MSSAAMSGPAATIHAANSLEVTERRFEMESREITSDLNEAMRERIGARLRELYAPVTDEPLPTSHVDLLLALRHKERDRLRALDKAA